MLGSCCVCHMASNAVGACLDTWVTTTCPQSLPLNRDLLRWHSQSELGWLLCVAVADLLHGGAGRLSSRGRPAARHPIQLQSDPHNPIALRSELPYQVLHRASNPDNVIIIVACAGLVSTFASGALDSALNSAGVSLVNIRRVMEGVACVIKAAGLVAFSQCRRPAYAV